MSEGGGGGSGTAIHCPLARRPPCPPPAVGERRVRKRMRRMWRQHLPHPGALPGGGRSGPAGQGLPAAPGGGSGLLPCPNFPRARAAVPAVPGSRRSLPRPAGWRRAVRAGRGSGSVSAAAPVLKPRFVRPDRHLVAVSSPQGSFFQGRPRVWFL